MVKKNYMSLVLVLMGVSFFFQFFLLAREVFAENQRSSDAVVDLKLGLLRESKSTIKPKTQEPRVSDTLSDEAKKKTTDEEKARVERNITLDK